MPYAIFLTGSASRFVEVVQDNETKFSIARAQDYGIALRYCFRQCHQDCQNGHWNV